jgi:hypothetical protein
VVVGEKWALRGHDRRELLSIEFLSPDLLAFEGSGLPIFNHHDDVSTPPDDDFHGIAHS